MFKVFYSSISPILSFSSLIPRPFTALINPLNLIYYFIAQVGISYECKCIDYLYSSLFQFFRCFIESRTRSDKIIDEEYFFIFSDEGIIDKNRIFCVQYPLLACFEGFLGNGNGVRIIFHHFYKRNSEWYKFIF